MTRQPSLPMHPSALPRQRLHAVTGLPERPPGFRGYCAWVDQEPPELRGLEPPRDAVYLCQVEWAWSPMNNRITACYLDPRPNHWLLWHRGPDEENLDGEWPWILYAWAARIDGVTDRAAAMHLLLDAWSDEARYNLLDHFHWMNEEALLSVADVHAIGRAVWPEEGGDE